MSFICLVSCLFSVIASTKTSSWVETKTHFSFIDSLFTLCYVIPVSCICSVMSLQICDEIHGIQTFFDISLTIVEVFFLL